LHTHTHTHTQPLSRVRYTSKEYTKHISLQYCLKIVLFFYLAPIKFVSNNLILRIRAKSRRNKIAFGLSRKIGVLIFRQVDGDTIVSAVPESSNTVTEKQAMAHANPDVESPEMLNGEII
jgi:hypothetical protein